MKKLLKLLGYIPKKEHNEEIKAIKYIALKLIKNVEKGNVKIGATDKQILLKETCPILKIGEIVRFGFTDIIGINDSGDALKVN